MTEKASHSLVDAHEATEEGAQGLAAADLASQVGNLLDEALEASGLGQRTLASKIGVTEGRVSQVLNGDGNLRVAAFARYMRAMGYIVHLSATPIEDDKPSLPKARNRKLARRGMIDSDADSAETITPTHSLPYFKRVIEMLRAHPGVSLERLKRLKSWSEPDSPDDLWHWAEIWRDLAHRNRRRLLSTDEQQLLGDARRRVIGEFSSFFQVEPARFGGWIDESLTESLKGRGLNLREDETEPLPK